MGKDATRPCDPQEQIEQLDLGIKLLEEKGAEFSECS